MYKNVKYLIEGDSAVIVEFGNEISIEINAIIRKYMEILENSRINGIKECVPTYRSITVNYDPLKISYENLIKELSKIKVDFKKDEKELVRLIEIPTIYGDEFGEDLPFVAENGKLSEEEVIKIHSGRDYLVYMMGFSPGFTYLGGMDERINTPRLKTPRKKIAAGSVGIAGSQTGMYPSDTPGGWQLIGRTPLKLYDVEKEPPVFIEAGDYIRYTPITKNEYEEIKGKVENGEYEVKIKMIPRGELHE